MTKQTDHLDSVIDEVAREMTAGAPDGAFRARVLARIEAGVDAHRRRRRAFVLAPIAAMALLAVLVTVFVARSGLDNGHIGPLVSRPASQATDRRLPTVEHDSTQIAASAAAAAPRIVIKGSRSASTPSRAQPVAAVAGFDRLELTPIDTTTLSTTAIPTDAIETDQLDTIPPLAIASLVPEDDRRRNR